MDKKAFIKSCRRSGYKYVEIAKILGVSRQRVEQLLHKERHYARQAVQNAKLKSEKCEYPDCTAIKTEAHHFDYNKPLEVSWLCVKHHKEFHKKTEKKKTKIKLCGCGKEALKHSIRCKDCAKKRARKMGRLNYKNNPERRRKQKLLNMRWRGNNPEKWNVIQKRAIKKYYLKNPLKRKEQNRLAFQNRYYSDIEKSRAYYRERNKIYYTNNKDIARAKARIRYYQRKLKVVDK